MTLGSYNFTLKKEEKNGERKLKNKSEKLWEYKKKLSFGQPEVGNCPI